MIKLTSVKNISFRSVTRNYTIVFLLLTILISASLYSIGTRNQELQQIISKQFTVNSIVKELSDITRSRREVMLLILDEDDAFNRDDLIQKYSNQASEFLKRREKIKLLNLSKIQTEMLNKSLKIVGNIYIHQTKAISFANEGDMLKVKKIFAEKILPLKAPIRDSYDELIHSMQHQSKIEIDNAQRANKNAIVIIIVLIGLIFILAIWIQFIATKKLKYAKDEAERSNKAKSEFLAGMSHELRTPLNAILGFSQLIQMKTKDEMTKENSQEIIDGGNHLLNLINEVLDLSKIESGTIDVLIKTHSFNKTFNSAMTLIQPIADKHAIQICNKVSSSSDININVDDTRFKQVLINIISNAIKYNTKNGKVTIDYSLDDKKMLSLSVTDTGKGLTAEQQTNIFLPFDRAGKENSNIEGTGLGLSISKKLIEQMDGTITVKSETGKGSCFLIQIPLS